MKSQQGLAPRPEAVEVIDCLRRWLGQVVDPVRAIRGVVKYPHYLYSWYRYSRLPNGEKIRLSDSSPQLHDNTRTSSFDSHYFYANGWAMRRILDSPPKMHVDVGSQTMFVNLLGGVIQTVHVDYRPLEVRLTGILPVGGNLLCLPFADRSLRSVSSLHVIEHVGLGRYGDPLDPEGTRKAAHELKRVLDSGGNLDLAIPVGRPRLCFNAHRIHSSEMVLELFRGLQLIEHSGVHDDGRYVEGVDMAEFLRSEYACAFYWFRRPA